MLQFLKGRRQVRNGSAPAVQPPYCATSISRPRAAFSSLSRSRRCDAPEQTSLTFSAIVVRSADQFRQESPARLQTVLPSPIGAQYEFGLRDNSARGAVKPGGASVSSSPGHLWRYAGRDPSGRREHGPRGLLPFLPALRCGIGLRPGHLDTCTRNRDIVSSEDAHQGPVDALSARPLPLHASPKPAARTAP